MPENLGYLGITTFICRYFGISVGTWPLFPLCLDSIFGEYQYFLVGRRGYDKTRTPSKLTYPFLMSQTTNKGQYISTYYWLYVVSMVEYHYISHTFWNCPVPLHQHTVVLDNSWCKSSLFL